MANEVLQLWGQPCPFMALPTEEMAIDAEALAAAGQGEQNKRKCLQHASLVRQAVALVDIVPLTA